MYSMEENNQTINCTVDHNCDHNLCELQQIQVEACTNCSNGRAKDESMCGSYRCKCD